MRRRLARLGWPACGIATLAYIVLAVAAPRSDILTTIAIDAPPAAVWSVLTDTDTYPAWNPMIAGLRGRLARDAVIENIEGYGADRTVIWPTVLVADRDHELRWRGQLRGVPGLLVGEHFSGALLWLFDPRELVPAFGAMNVTLAARSEHSQPAP